MLLQHLRQVSLWELCRAVLVGTSIASVTFAQGRIRACALVVACLFSVAQVLAWDRRRQRANGAALAAAAGKAGSSLWRDGWQDPLRFAFLGPGGSINRANAIDAAVFENEICTTRCLAIHRPTHERWREKTGEYPFAWHLAGRRRTWEIRVQMRLKRPPKNQIYFGVVPTKYQRASGLTRQVHEALIRVLKVLGDMYYSAGDDADSTVGEIEPPTVVLPLWAADQFVVSGPGQEPALEGDLEGLGMRRTDSITKYVKAFKALESELSPAKVYTFCFWGGSQFVDIINWELVGMFPGLRLDIADTAGPPPLYVMMYELRDSSEGETEHRHLPSRKLYYWHAALWSEKRQPSAEDRKTIHKLAEVAEQEEVKFSPSKQRASRLTSAFKRGCCSCR